METPKTFIIIGTSAAGIAAIQKIRHLDGASRIICFSEEAESPYNKCFLADYLAKEKELAAVYTKGRDFFESLSVELYLATRVVAIHCAEKTIECADGTRYAYTSLLLAVGGAPRNPTWRGREDLKNFFPFYTLRDALAVEAWVARKKPKNILIIGAGLTGLEVADALQSSGATLTVVEQQSRVLMRHLDQEGADYVAGAMKNCGVELLVGTGVFETYADRHGQVQDVSFMDLDQKPFGQRKKIDMVIEASGSAAQLKLPEAAGLAIEKGAVVTNEHLQTSDPVIFAAGDVALVKNRITGERVRTALWPDAVSQGMYAGYAIAGQPRPYPGVIPVASSTFFGVSFHSAGFLEPAHSHWTSMIERTEKGYARLILDENRVVKGFVCIGDLVSHMVAYKRSLVTGTPLAS